jgi:NTP pyrophosphatase (non-canonical NTP hydrolase)
MLTFRDFQEANRRRKAYYSSEHTVEALAMCLAEECGEVSAAVLGWSGEKQSKSHLTAKDIADEIADVITYCDLLCTRLGFDTATVLADKFNRVSDRIRCPIKVGEPVRDDEPTDFSCFYESERHTD